MEQGRSVRAPSTGRGERVEVVLVTAVGCHLCDDAKVVLADLGHRFNLDVREVDLSTDEGTALARRFGAPFPPLLFVGGAYVGHGRVSRRRLNRVIEHVGIGAAGAPSHDAGDVQGRQAASPGKDARRRRTSPCVEEEDAAGGVDRRPERGRCCESGH